MQPLQKQVSDDGQHTDQHGADDQHRHIAAADGSQNKYTQTAGADGSGDGHYTDVHHNSGAYTGQNHRHGDGQFDHAQALAEGHANTASGLTDTRLNTGERKKGIAHDGQQ